MHQTGAALSLRQCADRFLASRFDVAQMMVVALHLKYATRALLTCKRAARESGHASPDEGRHVRPFRRRGENNAWKSVSLLPYKAHLLSSILE